MIIIGITGPIGHGKSTLAEFLAKLEPNSRIFETSEVISEVANELNASVEDAHPEVDDIESINQWLSALPGILNSKLDVTVPADLFVITKAQVSNTPRDFEKLFEYIDQVSEKPDLADTTITQQNKGNYRAILQWIGGYCVTHIRRTIWNDELLRRAVSSDCSLAILGGVRFADEAENIKEHGGIIVEIERSHAEKQDADDPTERERSNIKCDTTVTNDGDLEALKQKSIELFHDIKTERRNKVY